MVLLGKRTSQVEVPQMPEEFVKLISPEVATQLSPECLQRITMLAGFRDMVGEREGYFFGAKIKRQEMNDATKEERKVATDLRKDFKKTIRVWVENGDVEAYDKALTGIADAREVVTKKTKPFRAKINPLNRAVKFFDTVAIPDALSEMGTPVQPRFSLSKYITNQIEEYKKQKKNA